MSELTKEEIDEMQGVVIAAKQSGFGKVELAIDIALELIAAARRLQAIESAGGLTAEQRKILQNCADWAAREKSKHKEQLGNCIAALLTSHDHLAAEVERLRGLLAQMRTKLEQIVCTVEPDAGVVLLSQDGPCH